MNWSLLVLIGATLNVFVNFGYKTQAAKGNLFFVVAVAYAVTTLALMGYAGFTKGIRMAPILQGWTPLIILGMGCGLAVVLVFFMTALSNGPLSLVDPMWACVYALVSLLVGMFILRETPGIVSLVGIGFYVLGAFLIARGSPAGS